MTTCVVKKQAITRAAVEVLAHGVESRLRELDRQMVEIAVTVKEIEQRQHVIRQLLAVDGG